MSETIIIYDTRYGATKKYATWMSEILQCECMLFSEVQLDKLKNYHTIIYGGGIYMNKIRGFNSFKQKYLPHLLDKEIILFGVGLLSTLDELKQHNLHNIKKEIPLLFFQGGINYTQMKWHHKKIIFLITKMLKNELKKESNEYKKQIVENYYKGLDFSNKTYIQEKFKEYNLFQ